MAGQAICSIPPLKASKTPTQSCSIGTNPRQEAPILNARIRKALAGLTSAMIALIGEAARPHL
jgi:NADH dehydrogenase/NADH:ubiquinone oxidoreductase subunit G